MPISRNLSATEISFPGGASRRGGMARVSGRRWRGYRPKLTLTHLLDIAAGRGSDRLRTRSRRPGRRPRDPGDTTVPLGDRHSRRSRRPPMAREFRGDEAKRRRVFAAMLYATASKRGLGQVQILKCCVAVGIGRDQIHAVSYQRLTLRGGRVVATFATFSKAPGSERSSKPGASLFLTWKRRIRRGRRMRRRRPRRRGAAAAAAAMSTPAPIAAAAPARRRARGTRSRSRMSIEARG